MTTIHRHALVPFTQRQMYDLVTNIEDYPTFLPWCSASNVLLQNETEQEATLVISWKNFHKSFTTRNTQHRYDHIKIDLISGPFKHLKGNWTFQIKNEGGCEVGLELDFEFSGGWMDLLFQPIFNHIANSMVGAFSQRAMEVYGKR